MVLRPQPPNPLEKRIRYASSAISACVTFVLDRMITMSSFTSAGLVNRCLDLINTVYSSTCTLARQSMSSSVSHLWSVFRPPWTLGPSLSPSFTALGLSAQHVSTNVLLSHRLSLCSTPAHQHSQETCFTQPHAWFRLKLNRSLPDNHSSQLDTHGHI